MQMAGIEVTKEQVLEALQDPKNYQTLKDKDGNPFLVATYNLDPDPTKTGETLEGPIPLMIAQKNEKEEWGWDDYSSILKNSGNFGHCFGSQTIPDQPVPEILEKYFNAATITYTWSRREPSQSQFKMGWMDTQLKVAKQMNATNIRLAHILTSDFYPDWVLNASKSEKEKLIRDHVRQVITYFVDRGVTQFNVVNEIWYSDDMARVFGRDEYVLIAFDEANKIRDEIINKAKQRGIPPPEIKLGLSHADNHYSNGVGTPQSLELLKILAERGLVDYIDVHFHIKDANNLPDPNDVRKVLETYQTFINSRTGKKIEVVVGEFDVNIAVYPQTDGARYKKQAEIYYEYLKTILESGINEITFWGVVDNFSWYELGDAGNKQPDADALLFDDNGSPKLSFFALLKAYCDVVYNGP